MIELPDIPDFYTQKTERVLLNAKAEEVVRIFHDRVKPYSNTVNYTDRIIEGESKSFAHYIRPIQQPIDNRLEVTDIIHANWQTKPVQVRIPVTVKALILQARQPTDKTVLINIEFSPFFESIVKDLLSKFEYDHAAIPKKTKKRKKISPCLPPTYGHAYKWVRFWHEMGPKLDEDKTLSNDYDQIREYLENKGIGNFRFRDETLRKIIDCGNRGGIPSLDEFEKNT